MTWCSPWVRQRTTDFSSRQVECDNIHPGRRLLSKRSLSTKPSIVSRIGFRCLASSRYSSLRPSTGRTSKITENIGFSLFVSGRRRRDVAAEQEIDAFLPKCRPHRFQMHQMGATANLDVTLFRRLSKGIEQPFRVVVQHQPVPLTTDDGDRRADQRRIIGQMAVPRLDDLAERTERGLGARGIARAALRVAVEIALRPFLEMSPRQNRPLVRGDVLDKPVPLILRSHDPPCRKESRRLVAP